MPYPQTRGPSVGTCNICGGRNKLTADHVPPKGVIRFDSAQLHSIIDVLGVLRGGAKPRGRFFQRGVKFRSLCEGCNTDILGTLYDPELVRFSNSVSDYLNSHLVVPAEASFVAKPGYVARAVAGHILAIGIERFPRGELGDALADFVLDPDASLPSKIGFYFWLYPYRHQVSIRSCGILVKGGAPPLVVSVLKFTPLAFMLAWDADSALHIPHQNLADYTAGSGAREVSIPLDFGRIPPERYPEAPGRQGAVLYGADAFLASSRER